MIRKFILGFVLLVMSVNGFAQHALKGTVISEEKEPLSYTTVVLLNPSDSTMKYYGVTNRDGFFYIKNIKKAAYLMQISNVGAKMLTEAINIPLTRGEDLGKIEMEKIAIDEVQVIGEYVPIRFRKDTVEFNAKAFITKPDAVVEELLKKLPGVEVDGAGNIKALGEEVKKVLVEGKEFFGKDLKVATKNLPADAIDKVQIFDKRSYEAEFMGVDDGIRDRTINLNLKEDRKLGYFGDLLAGAGVDLSKDMGEVNKFNSSGKYYKFTGNTQIAVLGNYNNVNEFGLASHGNNTFGSAIKGLNTAASGGINLNYSPTTFNKYYMSYLASPKKGILDVESNSENFINNGSYFQSTKNDEESINFPHSLNFGIHHKFDDTHNIIIRGSGSLSKNSLEKETLTTSNLDDDLYINNLHSLQNNASDNIGGNVIATHMMRLNEGSTQMKNMIMTNFSKNFSGVDYKNKYTTYNPEKVINTLPYQDLQTDNFSLSYNTQFVQKIVKNWWVVPDIKLGMNNNIYDKDQGNMLDKEKIKTDSLSPNFNREQKFLRASLALKRTTVNTLLNIKLLAVWNQLDKTLWDVPFDQSQYFHLLPSLTYENRFRTGRRFKINYTTGINLPTLTQLLPIVNNLNPIMLHQGNIDLEPTYSHSFVPEFSLFDQFSFTSLFISGYANYSINPISWEQSIDENLVKLNKPVNVADGYNAGANIKFATPIRRLGLKIDLGLNESWAKSYNIINTVKNTVNSFSHGINFSVENHIKGKWDVKLGGSVGITDAKYSIQDVDNEDYNNLYFNTVYFTNIRFMPGDHWDIGFDAGVTNYNSQSLDEKFNIPSINAEINYYFLTGSRAVISLKAVDLLDKNTGWSQISNINFLMQTQSNTIGRYIMLSFKYRFNKLGGKRRELLSLST